MSDFLTFTVIGIVVGATYAVAASGLVLTYATSNVFNMAHGAVGMFMTFTYWEVHVHQGWPTWLSLLFVLGFAAPALGLFLERIMMRRLTDAPVAISLVVTVGLLVALIGVAQVIWQPSGRNIDEFFVGKGVNIGSVRVTVHQFITLGIAMLVAGGLYLLLNRTRIGTAMRAVVDNRELLALHGARPNLLSGLAWALGSSLAALAGILLAPQLTLDYTTLTLLVISAYAAAMVGRLKSLPRTFLGAIVLGLVSNYAQWAYNSIDPQIIKDSQGLLYGIKVSLATIFLLVVMVLLPQEKLSIGRITGTKLPPLPSWRKTFAWAAVLLAAGWFLTGSLGEARNSQFGQAMCLPLIMLSLVLLVGYGGDISLCQLSFVGIGGVITAKGFHVGSLGFKPQISLVSIVAAFVITGLVGVLVAIPALRLRGLYIGLGTLAVAAAMDHIVFESQIFGLGAQGASRDVGRPGWLQSERSFAMAVVVAFVVMAIVVLAIRRGKYGRILLATRDSQAACATLGFSTTLTRIAVFGVSAGLAGVAGVFYGGMRASVGTTDFFFFKSLPLLLFAAVFGVTSITGVLAGGLVYGLIGYQSATISNLASVVLLIGILLLGGNPNGLVGLLFDLRTRLFGRATAPGAPVEDAPVPDYPPAYASRHEGGVVVG
ncbi:MAG: branched-chain amino acid transport system permease protein livM [Frankiales bacterium]|nr:branched-chain amino acid transport system permease protein livM [Frankiales bacterium]